MRKQVPKRTLPLSLLTFIAFGCGQEVRSIEVDPTTLEFTRSTQSELLEAKALDIRGLEVPNIPLTFHSEDPDVAEVDASGQVKPTGNGSTAVVVESPDGIRGESFIKVCLPQDIVCDPATLALKVGSAAPLKCRARDCKGENLSGILQLEPSDEKMLLKEGSDVFVGLATGETAVKVEGFGLEKSIPVVIEEQTFAPGMKPGEAGRRGGSKPPSREETKPAGRYDHILKNMKF